MTYTKDTRHAWACLLFLLPLLLVYEGGVLAFGGGDADSLRNGADAWLRAGLAQYGLDQIWVAPVLIVGLLLIRSWTNWQERPREPLGVGFGMLMESVLFAVILWLIARNFLTIIEATGIELPTASIAFATPAAEQLVTFVGAGIYEELLFRLGIYSILYFMLRLVLMPRFMAIALGAFIGSIIFAAAHHVGPAGEEMETIPFLFRMTAGLFFTMLYVFRGFGICVGAHAGYDILVGVAVE